MKIDVSAVRGIATDLRVSAQTVLEHSESVKSAVGGVDPAAAGRSYREWGDRLSQGCVGASQVLAMYGDSVLASGSALQTAASAYERTDRAGKDRIAGAEQSL